MNSRSAGRLKQIWVCTNSAPASTFLRDGGPIVVRRREGILDGADEEGGPRDRARPERYVPLIPKHPGDPQKMHRVDVEDRLGLRVVARGHVIAGQQEDIARPESRGSQEVRLQRQPVPVAAGELDDRLHPRLRHERPGRERRQVRVGRGIVGAVGRVDLSSQPAGEAPDFLGIGSVGRLHLGRDREAARPGSIQGSGAAFGLMPSRPSPARLDFRPRRRLRRRPSGGHLPVAAAREVRPRGGSLEPPVHGRLEALDVVLPEGSLSEPS